MPHHLLWSAEQNYLMVLQQKVFHSQHTNLEAILTLVKLRSETFQLIHRVIFALLNFAGSPISRAILILSCWQELEQEMIMSTKNIWLWAQRRIGIIKISSNTEQTDLIKNIFSILGTKKNLSEMRIKVWDQSILHSWSHLQIHSSVILKSPKLFNKQNHSKTTVTNRWNTELW